MIKSIEIDKRSMDNVIGDINSIIKILKSPEMQLHRAKKFRDYTVEMVSGGKLGLEKIKETTKKISGDHQPMYNTGGLLDRMSVRQTGDNSAGAGYFSGGSGKYSKNSLTDEDIAYIHHLQTGFRIPLTGEKGERVRKWLAWKGVFKTGAMEVARGFKESHQKSSGDKWIEVKPRPFIEISVNHYIAEDRDLKATNEFLDKELRKANV